MPFLKLIDSVVQPGKAVNEDLFDYNPQAAWVFDGASGIGANIIPGSPSDPYWLVHATNEALKELWNDQTPTTDLFRLAAERVIGQFGEHNIKPLPPLSDLPNACLLMARLWKGELELSTLGDCWLICLGKEGVSEFGRKLGNITGPIHREIKKLKSEGIFGADLAERLLPLEREIRSKVNTDDGYAIIDLTTRWTERLHQERRDVSLGDNFLLMTDGFYRLIDTYNAYNAKSLMNAVLQRGLKALYTELRDIEEKDEACKIYPRIKAKDDVAAALMKLEP